jgi:leucyl/phenylalanyl-tRNA--protein transferase
MEARHDVITPDMLIMAYSQGAFPMAQQASGKVAWYTADPRAVIPLDEKFHVPKSLARRVRSGRFTITFDRAFEHVMRACALPRNAQSETWINASLIEAYVAMHKMGLGHSVEAWLPIEAARKHAGGGVTDGARALAPNSDAGAEAGVPGMTLVGGLYGVSLGGAFFGESMFSVATDASKVCLVRLVEHLRSRGFALLDTQFSNPHLTQFGVQEVAAKDYLKRLGAAVAMDVEW